MKSTKRFDPVVVPEPTGHDYHVMVKPIGGVCNLQCAYCYYLPTVDMYKARPDFTGSFRMTLQTYELFARQYLDRPLEQIAFAWQGGEPTLMGLNWFRQAMDIQVRYRRDGQVVANSLQTNGTLLDDDWCDFFRRHDFLIGLSVDGPAAYHDKYRRTPDGQASHEKVQRGLKLLNKHGVECNALVVLSRANVHDPDGVYRFLANAGLRHVQLIPLLEYDRTTVEPIPQAITGVEYGRFLNRIFDLWFENNIGGIFVQTIEQTLAAHLGVSPSLCIHMPTCGRALILEHNGDVYACDHYPFPTHLRGNIHDKPLHEMVNSPEQLAFGRSKRDDLTGVCRACPYLPACNGGCCKHRIVALDEKNAPEPDTGGQAPQAGSGSTTAGGALRRNSQSAVAGDPPRHNWFCEGYRMFFEHSYDRLAAIATALRRGLPARTARDEYVARQGTPHPVLLDAAARPMRQAAPPAGKPDRNAPCPCGSGLKFKKCCGRER
jgi:uncharacterized protein